MKSSWRRAGVKSNSRLAEKKSVAGIAYLYGLRQKDLPFVTYLYWLFFWREAKKGTVMCTEMSFNLQHCEKVVPHTPGAVGSVAGEEAGANLRAELFITPAALTARSCQPGIVPTPRHTQRLAQPSRRPDPPGASQ
jgi:hypothetical protein